MNDFTLNSEIFNKFIERKPKEIKIKLDTM
jgi:hypothetical protein